MLRMFWEINFLTEKMDSLGKDVLSLIFQELPAKDALALGATCKLIHGESRKPSLWRKLVLRDFGVKVKNDVEPIDMYKFLREHGECEPVGCAAGVVMSDRFDQFKCYVSFDCEVRRDTSMWYAARYGKLDMVEYLLQRDVIKTELARYLLIAITNNQAEVVSRLLSDERFDPYENTAPSLILAMKSRHAAVICAFLSHPRVDAERVVEMILQHARFYNVEDRVMSLLKKWNPELY
jgi:hypothetical protein